MTVNENIKTMREQAGVSQAELSRKIDISQPFLCKIERGKKKPTLGYGYRNRKSIGLYNRRACSRRTAKGRRHTMNTAVIVTLIVCLTVVILAWDGKEK